MSKEQTPAGMAHSIYQAAVSELTAAKDPQLQREVLKSLGEMLHGPDQSAAEITTAIALHAHEKHALEAKLRHKFNRDLTFTYKVDPALLGGVVAKVGDRIIDGSLASRLNAMSETLLGGAR